LGGGKPDKVAKSADLKWVEHHAEHWREAKAKIRKIIGDLVGVDHVDQFPYEATKTTLSIGP